MSNNRNIVFIGIVGVIVIAALAFMFLGSSGDELDVVSPVADAGSSIDVDVGEVFTLDGSMSSDNIEISSYSWNLGEGTVKLGSILSHSYSIEGARAGRISTSNTGNRKR